MRVVLGLLALGWGCHVATPTRPAEPTRPTAPKRPAAPTAAATTPAKPPARAAPGPSISLTRTSCLGPCPDYTLTIHADGYVEYDGRHFVATAGAATGQIEQVEADRMFERLQAVDFFHLEDCADKLDVPLLIVEVRTAEQSHRVASNSGCTGPGIEQLHAAASELESTVQSDRWVGHVVPCGFSIAETIDFRAGGSTLSEPSRAVLHEVAEVLRALEAPATLVGSHGAHEPPELATARATTVRDALVAEGVAPRALAIDPATPTAKGSAGVSFRLDVPRCEEGLRFRWVAMPALGQ
jgi:hypothetical protein